MKKTKGDSDGYSHLEMVTSVNCGSRRLSLTSEILLAEAVTQSRRKRQDDGSC